LRWLAGRNEIVVIGRRPKRRQTTEERIEMSDTHLRSFTSRSMSSPTRSTNIRSLVLSASMIVGSTSIESVLLSVSAGVGLDAG
jgi:hypothetical protein